MTYIFVTSDLHLWPLLDFKYALLVTLVHLYVSTKLEVSTAILLRENRRHGTDRQTDGRTDRVQRLMQPLAAVFFQHTAGHIPVLSSTTGINRLRKKRLGYQ